MPPAFKPAIRALDPVFVIMLVAIILAVATSFTLRLAAGNLGPTRARADDAVPYFHRPTPPKPQAVEPATPIPRN